MLPASGIMVFETENHPETRSTQRMLPRNDPDRIQVAFDDHRLNQSQGGMCICRVLGIGAGVSRECFGP